MNKWLLAVLNATERLLVAQTERAELAALDEDAAIELETRIRRARNKYVGQYRRSASAAVAVHGGRGKARPENQRAAWKAEAFGAGPGERACRGAGPAVGRGPAGAAAGGGAGGPASQAALGRGPAPGRGAQRSAGHWRARR